MSSADLIAHLATGVTQTCRCWSIVRKDGAKFGFTDHDQPLHFENFGFLPQGGLSARAISNASGLSVNNSAALGVLSDSSITEVDISAGRFDDAEVTIWLVCWSDVTARDILFRGTIGEITRANGAFEAELNGLTQPLNQPIGRSYLRSCDAMLGDASCGIDLEHPDFAGEFAVVDGTSLSTLWIDIAGYEPRWFDAGLCEVITGDAKGLRQAVQSDEVVGQHRKVTLWAPFSIPMAKGDRVRLTAGCDKRPDTCRAKFANFINFRGFPDMPGEDWLVSVPRSGRVNAGGSLLR